MHQRGQASLFVRNEESDAVGPCVSAGSSRCSDKGFLAILERLGLAQSSWCELVSDFDKLFSGVAGKPSVVDSMRTPHGHRRMYLRRRVRELSCSEKPKGSIWLTPFECFHKIG
jgi:hypothetical protein